MYVAALDPAGCDQTVIAVKDTSSPNTTSKATNKATDATETGYR